MIKLIKKEEQMRSIDLQPTPARRGATAAVVLLIFMFLVIAGAAAFFWNRQQLAARELNAANAEITELQNQLRQTTAAATTDGGNETATAAVAAYHAAQLNAPDYEYSLVEEDGDYAVVSFGNDQAGARAFVKMAEGRWNVIIAGLQTSGPQCLNTEFGFPADWVASAPTEYEDLCR